VIEDNEIEGGPAEAIAVGEIGLKAFGTDPVIRNNTISQVPCGVTVAAAAAPRIEANDISVTELGLFFAERGSEQISGNMIRGGDGVADIVEGIETVDPEGDGFCFVEQDS
jgi:hypothetical protein